MTPDAAKGAGPVRPCAPFLSLVAALQVVPATPAIVETQRGAVIKAVTTQPCYAHSMSGLIAVSGAPTTRDRWSTPEQMARTRSERGRLH